MIQRPTAAELVRLEAALRAVPLREREVFMAMRFDDLSYRTIAARTGLSVRRVERLIDSAILQIDRYMERPARVSSH